MSEGYEGRRRRREIKRGGREGTKKGGMVSRLKKVGEEGWKGETEEGRKDGKGRHQ